MTSAVALPLGAVPSSSVPSNAVPSNSGPANTEAAPSVLTRRRLLGGAAVAAAAAVGGPILWRRLSASTPEAGTQQGAAARALGAAAVRPPGSLPNPALPAGADTLPGIDNIVVLMMENHSFDNFFGMLGRGDGFSLDRSGRPKATNPLVDGRLQRAFHMPTTCQLPSRPSNDWEASHNAYNGGRMNGFARTAIGPGSTEIVGSVAMGYWTGADLPFTYALARHFPIADRWFSSVMADTDPNRRYLIAGTSAGMTSDVGTGAGNAIANSELTIPLPEGTVFDLLSEHGISWLNYVESWPLGATPNLYPVNDGAIETANMRSFGQFFADAAGGKLPAFTLLDPNYSTQSQENPQNIAVGEAMLAQVVNAVGSGPQWRRTLLVVAYDEHGGYYDHVPPPVALAPDSIPPMIQPGESPYDGFARYGFRVPAFVVSPFARPGYVTHVLHDHTSVLAMVERKWNLPALTYRDANARDLTDFLDMAALRAGRPTFPTLPKLPPAGDTKAALACSTTGPGAIPPAGQ